MLVVKHHTPDQLQVMARTEQSARLSTRIRAVALAAQGHTAAQIASLLGYQLRTVQSWVHRYNKGGIKALSDKPGRGRRPPLTRQQLAELRARIEAGAKPEDGVQALRGKDIQRILREEFGKERSLSAVYDLINRMGCTVTGRQHKQRST